jgi:hypothetical protein
VCDVRVLRGSFYILGSKSRGREEERRRRRRFMWDTCRAESESIDRDRGLQR